MNSLDKFLQSKNKKVKEQPTLTSMLKKCEKELDKPIKLTQQNIFQIKKKKHQTVKKKGKKGKK